MLRRIAGDRYEADAGDQIHIVTQSRSNNGVNDARFEYADDVLPRETIQGLPGCTFIVDEGRKQFQAVVTFATGVGAAARYDLFEVDEVGGLSDLDQHVTKIDSAPLVGLAIEGVAVAAAIAGRRGAARATAPPRARRAPVKARQAKRRGENRGSTARRKSTTKRAPGGTASGGKKQRRATVKRRSNSAGRAGSRTRK